MEIQNSVFQIRTHLPAVKYLVVNLSEKLEYRNKNPN